MNIDVDSDALDAEKLVRMLGFFFMGELADGLSHASSI